MAVKGPLDLAGKPVKKSGGRPTRAASAALADTILDTAWRLLLANGFSLSSIDAISREAGASKRTIYDRFGSKEGLVEALVLRASEQWSQQTRDIIANTDEKDWLRALVNQILDIRSSYEARALNAFLTTEGHALPNVLKLRGKRNAETLKALSEHFRTHIRHYPQGEDGIRLARNLVAFLSGWANTFPEIQPDIHDPGLRAYIYQQVCTLLVAHGCQLD